VNRPPIVPAVLVVLAFVAGAIASPFFLDVRYLLDASSLYAETGLLVLGVTLVIVAGQIDLSVAAIMALVACVVAKMLAAGLPVPVVLAAGLGLGAGLGLINGWLVAYLRLPSFVVTLATMASFRGVAQVLMGAESQRLPAGLVGIDYAKVPGTPIPVPLAMVAVFSVAIGVLLHRTVFGRTIVAVGTNERASTFSGVRTERVKLLVFMLSGLLAAVAGMMIDSRLGVARFDHGKGLEVDVIAAVVVGGASIYGGVGTVLGSVLALLLIALIRTGLGVANVGAEYQLAAVGTLLIVAVLVGNVSEHWSKLRPAKSPPQ
jgi:rhamnose transport system permease protein